MGVFSEMSIEQERGDSPTSANIVPSAPAEPETPAWDEPAVTAPPAFEEEPHQKTEPETDPAALIQVNDAPDGEQTVPQTSDAADGHENTADSKDEDDAKRKAHEAAEAWTSPKDQIPREGFPVCTKDHLSHSDEDYQSNQRS